MPSECQTVWIQTVCTAYLQTTQVGKELKDIKMNKIHISSGFISLGFIMHCLILSVAWVQGAAFFLPQRS